MTELVSRSVLGVWSLLVAATLVTWWVGADHPPDLAGVRIGAVVAIVIAFGKVWLIGRHFMELREAARPLRYAFDGWVLVVGAALAALAVS